MCTSPVQTLLEAVVADPAFSVASLPVMDSHHQRLVLDTFNATETKWPSQACIHQLFEFQVGNQPQAPCLVSPLASMTYGEVDARANQVAHMLRGMGVGPDVRACILMERGLDAYVSMLGVLKSGGAYVPLDPDYPADRLVYMLRDSQAVVLLTTARAAAKQPDLCAQAPQVLPSLQAIVPFVFPKILCSAFSGGDAFLGKVVPP